MDGLPDGLPGGVNDKDFTGLHRLEYGLWHGQPAAALLPVAERLARDVAAVRKNLTSADLAGDPTKLPLRAHEILEDALRDHLSGSTTRAAGRPTRDLRRPQVDGPCWASCPRSSPRGPELLATAERQLDALTAALLATRADGQWQSLTASPRWPPGSG